MGSHELIALLAETAAACSAAVLLVLLLRRLLRRRYGAAVGYAAWLLVPAAIVAVLLPAAVAEPTASTVRVLLAASASTMPVQTGTGIDVARVLCAIWMLGAIGMAWRFARQQRAFRRGLGALRRRDDGLQQAASIVGLPAAIGLWRASIVVPADFDTRYTPAQQRLMHAHEAMHIRRGDLQINAVAAALRCVFWFNPLLHAAIRHFRHDQELACDQRVIARHPSARRDYGEAMFKTQLAAQPLPLGCHWAAVFRTNRNTHPLKERIAMLKQPVPSLSRWIVGSAVVGVLTVGTGVAAWAAQPARAASGVVSVSQPVSSAHAVAPAAPRVRTGHARSQQSPPSGAAAPAARESSTSSSSPGSIAVSRTPAPPYPADALAKRIAGQVLLVIDIDAQGKPVNVQVEQSEPAGVFDQAAIDSAKQWQFKPELQNGQPVAGRVRVPIQFVPPGAPRPSSSSELSTAGEQVAAGGIEIQLSHLASLNLSPQYRWVRIDQLKQRDVTIGCDIMSVSSPAPDSPSFCGHRL